MSKLLDAIKTMKGAGVDIPDVSRDDLPELFHEMGFKVGVEIGVAKGKFSRVLCSKGAKLYAVDPYQSYDDYDTDGNQARLDYELKQARHRMKGYDCEFIRKTSMEAVKDFKDGSIDFVYIDGHHGFKYVTEDIFEWSKKVKKGGIISGHDFIFTRADHHSPFACHVKIVVPAYTKAFRIDNWYVLGDYNAQEGHKRDHWRSWLWINQ